MATNDVLSLAETKKALHSVIAGNDRDDQLEVTITAVSQLLDENCGPIVQRIETNTVYTTNPVTVDLPGPIHAIGSVTSYVGDTATVLSESATNGYRLTPRLKGTGSYTGTITRIGGSFGDRVVVNATMGRYATTTAVHPKFKLAALDTIRNLWRADEISVGNVDGFDVPYPTFPASYAIPNSVRDMLGEDWNGHRNRDHVTVMFG